MSKAEMLRAFVNQRLSLAAAEIFEQFERTIAEYEEELESRSKENQRQHELLDALSNPEVRSHTAVSPDLHQLLEVKEEVPSKKQKWSSSLDQEDPEPPHIKEEKEELWISQEGEQLRGLEEAENKFPSVPVKSEEDEERAQSSRLHERQTEENREAERTDADGEDWGGPEPQSPSQPEYSSEPETDDSGDWEETEEPQSASNLLHNKEEPEPQSRLNLLQNNEECDVACDTGEPSVLSSGCAGSFQQRHWVQTGEKHFSCLFCGKTFALKVSLRRHLSVHTGVKPFSCLVCGKRYPLKSSLRVHMKLHSEGKHFPCSVCKTVFSSNGNLVNHMRIHTGEKPFSCSICNKSFTRKGNLKEHMSVHTGEKPFSCSFCGKRFAHHSNLTRHITVHTARKPFSYSVSR